MVGEQQASTFASQLPLQANHPASSHSSAQQQQQQRRRLRLRCAPVHVHNLSGDGRCVELHCVDESGSSAGHLDDSGPATGALQALVADGAVFGAAVKIRVLRAEQAGWGCRGALGLPADVCGVRDMCTRPGDRLLLVATQSVGDCGGASPGGGVGGGGGGRVLLFDPRVPGPVAGVVPAGGGHVWSCAWNQPGTNLNQV